MFACVRTKENHWYTLENEFLTNTKDEEKKKKKKREKKKIL